MYKADRGILFYLWQWVAEGLISVYLGMYLGLRWPYSAGHMMQIYSLIPNFTTTSAIIPGSLSFHITITLDNDDATFALAYQLVRDEPSRWLFGYIPLNFP